jgi:AAA15 family ATPase/GTPase
MSLYSIDIKNFRGIKELNIADFSLVNLFVGKNNCGKTSILEAIFLTIGISNPQLAINIDTFRGILHDENDDFNFIFYNLDPSNRISIRTQFVNPSQYRQLFISPVNSSIRNNIKREVKVASTSDFSTTTTMPPEKSIAGINFEFSVKTLKQSKDNYLKASIELNPGGLKIQTANNYTEKMMGVYLNSRTINQNLHERLDKIIQNKEQKKIIKTLNQIDPRISEISLGSKNMIYFDIGIDRLIPIQLMGDGISRLLSILVTIANTANGIVLIDEIENGLHASTLEMLWGLIKEAAQTYNVQVFATSHSLECVKTFSDSFNSDILNKDTAKLFRLEKSQNNIFSTFDYTSEVLKAAIENNWEVR